MYKKISWYLSKLYPVGVRHGLFARWLRARAGTSGDTNAHCLVWWRHWTPRRHSMDIQCVMLYRISASLVDQNETRKINAMVELEPVFWNFTLKLDNATRANETTAGYPADEYYNIVHVTETKILPAFIGFLCSTGLVGNVLVLVTILRWVNRLRRKPHFFASVFN